jgi:hypothetical protein
VVAKAQAILPESELLRAIFVVGHFPPNTRGALFVDLPENRGSVIYRLPNPSQKASRSTLNWVGERKLSPWERQHEHLPRR